VGIQLFELEGMKTSMGQPQQQLHHILRGGKKKKSKFYLDLPA